MPDLVDLPYRVEYVTRGHDGYLVTLVSGEFSVLRLWVEGGEPPSVGDTYLVTVRKA